MNNVLKIFSGAVVGSFMVALLVAVQHPSWDVSPRGVVVGLRSLGIAGSDRAADHVARSLDQVTQLGVSVVATLPEVGNVFANVLDTASADLVTQLQAPHLIDSASILVSGFTDDLVR